MKVIQIAWKHILWALWGISVTIICDLKINHIMYEPPYVKVFF